MIWLFKQLLHVRNVFRSGDTPRQLAFGVGLGVMLGLVMNGNLLAVGLTFLVCATRANLSMVALTTLVVGCIAHVTDPITHQIGYTVLTLPALQGTFQWMYQLPLVAWTDFNHTVVMGSFLLGVTLVYPTYRVTLPLFRRWKRRGQNRLLAPLQAATSPSASPAALDTPQLPSGVATDSTPTPNSAGQDSAAQSTTEDRPGEQAERAIVSHDRLEMHTQRDSEAQQATPVDTPKREQPAAPQPSTVLQQGPATQHVNGDSENSAAEPDNLSPTLDHQPAADEPPQIPPVPHADAFHEIPKSHYGFRSGTDLTTE